MADDIAVLGIEVDSRDVKLAARDLVSLVDAAKKAGAEADKLEREMDLLRKQMSNMLAPLNSLRTLLLGLGVGVAVREIIQLADAYTLTTARLRLVTKSTDELRQVQAALFQIAQNTQSSYAGTAELYTRMARNADALGLSTAEMLRINDLFTKSLKISGVSAAEADSVIRQFTQSLTKGKVSGDEFNSLLENAGGLLDHVAKGLGITTSALVRMGKDGGVATSLVLQGLGKAGAMIDQQFSTIPKTVGGAIQEVKNAFGQYVDEINSSTGTTNSLAEAIAGIADVFNRPEFKEGGIKFAELLASGIERAVELGPTIITNLENIGSAIGLLIEGYQKLPQEIQDWGLIVGLILGKKGVAGLAIIAAIEQAVPRLRNAWREMVSDTEMATNAYQDFIRGFTMPTSGLPEAVDEFQKLNTQTQRNRLLTEQAAMNAFKLERSFDNLNLNIKEQHEWTTKDQQAWDKLMRTYDKEIELEKKVRDGIRGTVQGLRDKVAVMQQELAQGATAARRLELELDLREKLKLATKEEAEEVRGLLAQIDQLTAGLEAKEQRQKAMEDQAEAYIQVWKNALEEIQRVMASTFDQALRGNIKSFSDFGNAILAIWRQVIAQMAAQQVMLATGLATAVQGGASGATGGALAGVGAANAINLWGAQNLGTGITLGALQSAPAGSLPLSAMGGGASLTGILGGAGVGALAGNVVGNVLGARNNIAPTIGGGALGAMWMAGASNPALAAVAAIATIASMFGNRPSSMLEGNKINMGTGAISPFDLGPNKDSPQNRGIADQFANSILTLGRGLTGVSGGRLGTPYINVSADSRNGIGVSYDPGAGDASFQYFKTLDEAWRSVVQRMVTTLEGASDEFNQALSVLDFSTEAGANAAFEKLAVLQQFLDIEEALANPQGPVSAVKQAIDALNTQFNEMRDTVEGLGISTDRFNGVLQGQLDLIKGSFSDSVMRLANDASGNGFINSILDAVTSKNTMAGDATALGLVNLLPTIDKIFEDTVKGIVQNGHLTVDQLNLIKTTFSNLPAVIAAADDALEAFKEVVDPGP